MTWGNAYIDAWNARDLDAIVAAFAPGCIYDDVPFGVTVEGHDGVRGLAMQMFATAPDIHFDLVREAKLGDAFSMEWRMRGSTNGADFAIHGVSVGERDAEGRISAIRDYWDARAFPQGSEGAS